MKSLPLLLVAAIVAGAALAGGMYVRERLDPPAAEIITVEQTRTDFAHTGRRPEFWLSDPEGARRGISEWDGKLVVMNFWATWCPPCLHEIPMFIALQKRYQARGVQFLGVAIDEAEKVREFADSVGLNYPTLHGQLDAIEVMGAYGNNSGGLPFTVLIDRDGQVVARHPGVLNEETATALIDRFL